MNTFEKQILSLYDNVNLGHNTTCSACQKDNPNLYNRAVGMWFVGNKYQEQTVRLLFIGKNARGVPGIDEPENQNEKGYLNEFIYSRNELWEKSWAYWDYTELISNQIFGNGGLENVAFTNMVKCNGSATKDTTTPSMKNYCIKQLQILKNELSVLLPTHVVFYTGKSYDNWIPFAFDSLYEITNICISVGAKEMPWSEYSATIGNHSIHVLRIGHPERKKKTDYTTHICDWVKKTQIIM